MKSIVRSRSTSTVALPVTPACRVFFIGSPFVGVGCDAVSQAQVRLLHLRIAQQLGSRPAQHDAAGFHHVAAIGDRQCGTRVLVLSLIHISEPTRRTPISYAVFCLK